MKQHTIEYQRAWRARNRERLNEKARMHRLANREKYREYSKNRYAKNKVRALAAQRKYHYGITHDDMLSMLKRQGNRCAICTVELHGGRETHVDHDHSTGVIRGLLCAGHNHGIGFFHDSIEELLAAASYLGNGK